MLTFIYLIFTGYSKKQDWLVKQVNKQNVLKSFISLVCQKGQVDLKHHHNYSVYFLFCSISWFVLAS